MTQTVKNRAKTLLNAEHLKGRHDWNQMSTPANFPVALLVFFAHLCCVSLVAQEATEPPDSTDEAVPGVAQQVEVQPVAEDVDIAVRLTRIMEATGWFDEPVAAVEEGVVFLEGTADSQAHKEWAGRLAGNTQDVVAVVNRMALQEEPLWDFTPAVTDLEEIAANAVRSSPLILVGGILLVLAWYLSAMSVRVSSLLIGRRVKSQLLRDVASRAVAIPVFLLGVYLVLKVSGLTRLAVTVLGGTGLIGLVVGFAFRDITENFLASILLSLQHPFQHADLIEVAGYQGFVQSVNTRSTLLMTLDGNHVQIPNATIYKETITNFTSNPQTRSEFDIGIGYDDSVADAQSIALSVLTNHPAVIDDPEPLVLVESLGAATVNLRVHFWVDGIRYSRLRVRSAVIRLVKRAFEDAGISMPDEAREVVFPAGVPVQMVGDDHYSSERRLSAAKRDATVEPTAHIAEGALSSEAEEIEQQARQSRSPETGPDLLSS